jgi:hypothetical protein
MLPEKGLLKETSKKRKKKIAEKGKSGIEDKYLGIDT